MKRSEVEALLAEAKVCSAHLMRCVVPTSRLIALCEALLHAMDWHEGGHEDTPCPCGNTDCPVAEWEWEG